MLIRTLIINYHYLIKLSSLTTKPSLTFGTSFYLYSLSHRSDSVSNLMNLGVQFAVSVIMCHDDVILTSCTGFYYIPLRMGP